MVKKPLIIAVLITLVASGAMAQGTITDGAAVFTFNANIAIPETGNADFIWEGVEQLHQSWWWYRLAGDPFESPLPVPDNQDYTGRFATLEWINVDGRGFNVNLQVGLGDCRVPDSCYDVGEGAYGLVLFYVTIINPTLNPMNIELFAYNDLDVGFGGTNDLAELLPFFQTASIVVRDDSANVVFFSNPESLYQVTPFALVRSELVDSDIDDLDGSGLPFGPGDFTGAYQFSLSIPSLDSVLVTTGLYVNFPFFANSFESGDTGSWSQTSP